MRAMLHALSDQKELLVTDTEPYEASAVLAALPTTSLRVLVMHLSWTDDPSHWQDLQSQISRFSELRTLECQDPDLYTIPDRVLLHPSRHPDQHMSLPNLFELRTTDYVFLALFESAGTLRQTLPNLQALHITMSRSRHASAVSACLSESSLFLAKLSISSATSAGVPGQWFLTLPAVRCLEISSKTFVDGAAESELLGYLATARGTLESVEFEEGVEVTDHLLRALTGVGRPPRLRRIRLDHVVQDSSEWISEDLERHEAAKLHENAEDLRQIYQPRWPVGGTEEGLRLALAAANENGIQVTGHALDCIEWNTNFDRVLSDRMMEQALKMDRYDYVIARFGAEAAVAWLKKRAPNTIPLLRAHGSALDSDDDTET